MSSKQVVTSKYVPREHALAFHARAQRFSVMVMHRRAGKTIACVNDLIDKAIQCHLPYPQFGYLAPYYSQAKSIAWVYLKHYAEPLIDKVMESELSVILKNGAKIRLYGADNPDSLRGMYFDGVVLDEYGDMSPRIFGEVIAPTLTDRRGWAVFIGTPKGKNHFFDLWEDAKESKGWFTQMLKASESGIIDKEELEMLKNMPGSDENTYRQEFECDFTAALRGSYYGDQLNALETSNTGSYPYDPDRAVHVSFDIGYSDDTSCWFFQSDGRNFAIVDFFTVSGFSVDDLLSNLRSRPYVYGTFYLPHDARNKSFQTGKSVRELMQAAGCQTQLVAQLSIQDGIQAVRKTLPNCYFNTDNKDVRVGLSALKSYQREWDDKKQIFREQPKHDWSSNPADSFRYLALAMNPLATQKASRVISQQQKPNNVINLENLYADREARQAGPKRI